MSDPQEAATPPDPHSAEAGFRFTDAQWREYQNMPEQGYSHRHWLEYTFDSWRDAEVAELKAKIAELEHQLKVQAFEHLRDLMEELEDHPASSPVEGGN